MSNTERPITKLKYFYNSLVSIMSDDLEMFGTEEEEEEWEEDPDESEEEDFSESW